VRKLSIVFILAVFLFCFCSEDSFNISYLDIVAPIDGGCGIEMVSLPGGAFLMGSNFRPVFWMIQNPKGSGEIPYYNPERPVHPVSLDDFSISMAEITQEQYSAVMESNPSFFSEYTNLPVERITWYEAATFCNKLSIMTGRDTCYNLTTFECDFKSNGFRLPTEAEWEYACRAGTKTEYFFGSDSAGLKNVGWYLDNSNGRTQQIRIKEPNPWGLYDMHGNVSEWCNDFEVSYHCNSEKNPTGPEEGHYRIIRGGSWFNGPDSSRSAFRMSTFPAFGFNNVGFRIVCR
jgi:formylglycine-generating enzyme required for sulfatase activity